MPSPTDTPERLAIERLLTDLRRAGHKVTQNIATESVAIDGRALSYAEFRRAAASYDGNLDTFYDLIPAPED